MMAFPYFTWLLILGLAAVRAPAQVPANPDKFRAQYNTVASHLDPGGDLMIVANVNGVVEQVVDVLRGIAELGPAARPGGNPAQAIFARLPAFVQSSGLYAVDGFGMSVVPRADGLNDFKLFLCRDPAAAKLPLWLGTIGGAPKALASLDYLPADTVLARVGTGDPRQMWKLVTEAVRQVGGPDTAKSFEDSLAEVNALLGTNLESVVASLDAEAFFAVQVSAAETLTVPLPGASGAEPLIIPRPSLLVGTAVRDATLLVALQNALAGKKMPVERALFNGTALFSVPVPAALPIPLSPTFAIHGGMFLLGSSSNAVQAAIAAAEGKNGLRQSPEFQKAFAGQSLAANNGLAYVSPRFSAALAGVQSRLLAAAPGGGAGLFQHLLSGETNGFAAVVFVNERDGVAVRGTTSSSGRQMLVSLALAPGAMMAAVAVVPSFTRSRQAAQGASCINNLRLLDHAKEQWAVAENKNNGDTPTMKDVLQYLRRMPVCPEGGTYTIGAVGTPPTCTIPGHRLP